MTVKRRLARMEATFRLPPEAMPVPQKWVRLFAAIPEFTDPEKTAREYLLWCASEGKEPSTALIIKLATANLCAAPNTSVMERVAMVASGACPYGERRAGQGEDSTELCAACGRSPRQGRARGAS
jgi:hypothetical protein